MPLTIDVTQPPYGAAGDGVTNDRAAIQAAVDAAHNHYVATGEIATVEIPAGVYILDASGVDKTDAGIQIRSGVTIQGAGIGQTIIKVADDSEGNGMTGIMRTPYGEETRFVTIDGLTMDGNRANNDPLYKVDGFFCGTVPLAGTSAYDITVTNVEIKDCSGYGFDPHEQTTRLTLENNISHGNHLDGFTLDFQNGAVIRNNVAYDNERHGFNIVTSTNNSVFEGNVSHDNGSAGIVIQRGSTDIAWPTNIQIVGGEVYGNAREGILIKMSDHVVVDGVHVHDNQRHGVHIYGGFNVTVQDSVIEHNGLAGSSFDEINVQAYLDDLTGSTFTPHAIHITDNTFNSTTAGKAIEEEAAVYDTLIDGNVFNGLASPTRTGPQVRTPIPDMTLSHTAAFSYVIAPTAIVDIDAFDQVTLALQRVDINGVLVSGGALPTWMTFNAATRTISGDAPSNGTGTYYFRVVATDLSGDQTVDQFRMIMNSAAPITTTTPTVVTPILDQNPEPGAAFNFQVPAGTFRDPDIQDALHYTATLANGSALPAWLTFNAATQTFSGTPGAGNVGELDIKVTAIDNGNHSVSDTFHMSVGAFNDAPVLADPIDDQVLPSWGHLSFTIPAGTFTDEETPNMAMTATLANGSPLPAWLTFNVATKTFTGDPGPANIGTLQIKVTATDDGGKFITDTFQLKVTPVLNVTDFGAVGDGTTDCKAAIQAAVDAAYAAGGGTVYIPAGVYMLFTSGIDNSDAGIVLRSNVSLVGDGMGQSVLKIAGGGLGEGVTGIVRTPYNEVVSNVAVHGLTLDGNKANQDAAYKIDGFFCGTAPDSPYSTYDITLTEVEIQNCTGYGFDPHEKTTRLTIEDCVSHDNVLDGFTIDYCIDTVIENNLAYNNGRHGFNIVTTSNGITLDGNVSHDNGSAGITVQRGSDNIPSPYDILITGGEVYGNAREGILIKMSHDIVVDGVNIHDNQRQGVLIQGSANVAVLNSTLTNDARQSTSYNEIDILPFLDPATNTSFTPSGIIVTGNTLTDSGPGLAKYGISEAPEALNTYINGNVITGFSLAPTHTGVQVRMPTPDLQANLNPFTYVIPAGAYVDIDPGAVTTLTLQLCDVNGVLIGSGALPAWISFNSATRTISGDAASGNVGTYYFRVSASDIDLGATYDVFRFVVSSTTGANPPVLQTPIPDMAGEPTQAFNYVIPAGTFFDPDLGDTMTVTAKLTSGAALPAWLTFNAATRTFSGTPPSAAVLNIRVTATDAGAHAVFDDFVLTIVTVDDLPVLAIPIVDTTAVVDTAVNYVLPAGTFTDEETPNLTLTATLANGDPLPIWLTFNAATRTFSGTPGAGDVATLQIKVTATDSGSQTVSDIFQMIVASGLTIVGTPGDDPNLTGGAGKDTISGLAGNDVIDGGANADTMDGGDGNDTYTVDNALDVITEAANAGLGGVDLVKSSIAFDLNMDSDLENLTLLGTADINATGNNKANIITGNAGANLITGGLGADTMIGGAGNDTYMVGETTDVVTEALNEGVDLVIANVSYTLGANVENLTLTGGTTGTGNALNNVIVGTAGNNTLTGGDGDDNLTGGGGLDQLTGGIGNDTYNVDSTDDNITEGVNEGIDQVFASATHTLKTNVENLTLTGVLAIDGIGNAGNNVMIGNSAANSFSGSGGTDLLNGMGGGDTLSGGSANDTFQFSDPADSTFAAPDTITDFAPTQDTIDLAAIDANALVAGDQDFHLVTSFSGQAGEMRMVFNSGPNTTTLLFEIDGDGDGDDMAIVVNGQLTGLQGITGVQGNFAPFVANPLADQNAQEDHLFSFQVPADAFADTDFGDVLHYDATLADGSPLPGWLVFNIGTRTFSGTPPAANVGVLSVKVTVDDGHTATASDVFTITVAAFDDLPVLAVPIVDKQVSANEALNYAVPAGTFTDEEGAIHYVSATLVDGSPLPAWLSFNTSTGTFTGTPAPADIGAITVRVNAADGGNQPIFDDFILTVTAGNSIVGTPGDDPALDGGAGNDSILGLAGNDRLDGKAGADAMNGGDGNDTFVVDNAGDTIVEADNGGLGGVDLVLSSINFNLLTADPDLENLTLTGSANLTGTGNGKANTITGNSGNNLLDGGGNSDTMIGGLGDDTYMVAQTGDVVTEALNEGVDTVISSTSLVLTYANVENFTLTAGTTITGNGLNNVMTGHAGNNVLIGGDGADTFFGGGGLDDMRGGLGDDVYNVDSADDITSEVAGEGTDVVFSTVSLTLNANVEVLNLVGPAALNGTGNGANNTLNGNSFDNLLSGQAGADLLVGGLGVDTLTGGTGADTFRFNAVNDSSAVTPDIITDFDPLSDQIDLDPIDANLTLAGDQDFHLVAAFTGHAGEVTATYDGGQNRTTFLFDIDGDSFGDDMGLIVNGNQTSMAGFLGAASNTPPTLSNPMADQNGAEDAAFSFTFAANVFTDTDVGDSFTYAATLLNGDPLPSWLVFDGVTRTFSGTPTQADVGTLQIKVTATDSGSASVNDAFDLTIAPTNDAPTVATPIADQPAPEDSVFSFVVPVGTFNDVDPADTMAWSATLVGGGALPAWLSFNAATQTFSGTPLNANVGSFTVRVTVTDSALAAAFDDFVITVANTNDAPTLVTPITDKVATTGGDFSYQAPVGTFADVDVGDTLTWSATLSSGAALPAWLTFNPATRTFSGTAGATTLDVRLRVTDGSAATVFDDFLITISQPGQLITGTSANSTHNGGSGNDTINAGSGNDTVNGLGGNDTLNGENGNDLIDGGIGNDTMVGGSGNDTYVVDATTDVTTETSSSGGTDLIRTSVTRTLGANFENLTLLAGFLINGTGNTLDNTLTGNELANLLTGGDGEDTITGGAGNDTINGDDDEDILSGGDNNDVIHGGLLDDTLNGDAGDDTLYGDEDDDLINGGTGNDTIFGGVANDTISGGDGADSVSGDAGNDTIGGGIGGDILNGGIGNDTIAGNEDGDTIDGGDGNDRLTGDAGNDTILGGIGTDSLTGGAGQDTMTGGAGADTFVYTALTDSTVAAPDRITDLTAAQNDRVNVSAIDANANLAGNQNFVLAAAFTNVAGQMTLTYNAGLGQTTALFDVNGDGQADMSIVLVGQFANAALFTL